MRRVFSTKPAMSFWSNGRSGGRDFGSTEVSHGRSFFKPMSSASCLSSSSMSGTTSFATLSPN